MFLLSNLRSELNQSFTTSKLYILLIINQLFYLLQNLLNLLPAFVEVVNLKWVTFRLRGIRLVEINYTGHVQERVNIKINLTWN